MKTARTALVALATLAFAGGALAQGCQPSKWGADDQMGAGNLVTPERTKEALKLVKQGKSHGLGIVIGPETPAFAPRSLNLQVVQPGQQAGQYARMGYDGSYNDDIVQMWFGIGSQIDGLGHLGEHNTYYNCNTAAEISQITGLTKLGVEHIPPLVARAVLVDMTKARGKDHLDAGETINAEELQQAMQDQGIEVGEGDIVLIHTGWTDAMLKDDPQAWVSGEPGILPDAAEWLAEQNVMAVGADIWGLDVVPAPEGGKTFYSHVVLLKQNGIYILETMNTGPLAEEGVKEFMFVLGQPKVRGAVQMIINPVALY